MSDVLVYVLKRPDGQLVAHTATPDERTAHVAAFDQVSIDVKGFGEKYWKQWEPAQRAIRELGYRVVKCKLLEC